MPTWLSSRARTALRQTLYDVFVESKQPLAPTRIKQWSAKLTSEQREIMHAPPAATPGRASLVRR